MYTGCSISLDFAYLHCLQSFKKIQYTGCPISLDIAYTGCHISLGIAYTGCPISLDITYVYRMSHQCKHSVFTLFAISLDIAYLQGVPITLENAIYSICHQFSHPVLPVSINSLDDHALNIQCVPSV